MEQVLYKLPDGWEWKKLGALFDIGSSKRVHQKDWTTEGVPFYRAREIVLLSKNGSVDNELFISESMYQSFAAKYGLPESGDILVTGVGTLGVCYVVKENDNFYYKDGNIICLKRKSEKINSRFVEYAFQSSVLKRQVNDSAGSVVATYTISRAKSTDIPFAPIEEQKRIVEKLDALFTRIDTAIEHLRSKLDLSKTLFDSILDEFFKVADCDSVPLTDVVDFIGGSQPPKLEFSDIPKEGFVRLIQIRDYKSDNFIVYVDSASTKKFCTKDDIMIGRYGPPVFQILRGLEGAYNVALMKAVPNEDILTKDYLYWFLQSPSIQNYVISISQRAAGQSGVNKSALEKYLIPIPSKEIQDAIVERVGQLVSKSRDLESEVSAEIESLSQLKASILDSAFKGEL